MSHLHKDGVVCKWIKSACKLQRLTFGRHPRAYHELHLDEFYECILVTMQASVVVTRGGFSDWSVAGLTADPPATWFR